MSINTNSVVFCQLWVKMWLKYSDKSPFPYIKIDLLEFLFPDIWLYKNAPNICIKKLLNNFLNMFAFNIYLTKVIKCNMPIYCK